MTRRLPAEISQERNRMEGKSVVNILHMEGENVELMEKSKPSTLTFQG